MPRQLLGWRGANQLFCSLTFFIAALTRVFFSFGVKAFHSLRNSFDTSARSCLGFGSPDEDCSVTMLI